MNLAILKILWKDATPWLIGAGSLVACVAMFLAPGYLLGGSGIQQVEWSFLFWSLVCFAWIAAAKFCEILRHSTKYIRSVKERANKKRGK